MPNLEVPANQSDAPRGQSPAASLSGSGTSEEEPGSSLIDLLFAALLVLAPRKGLILCLTLLGTAGGVWYAVTSPNKYTATAVVLPPQQPQQSTAAALLGQLGGLGGTAGGALGFKPGDLYVGMLGSRSIADSLINRFHLKEEYRVKTMTAARGALKARSRFSAALNSLIKIEVDAASPAVAAALANGYIEELDKQNTRLATTDAGQRRAFLESRLKVEKRALNDAEEEMTRVQHQTGILHLDSQETLTIASIAQVRAQIAAGEVALQRLGMGATDLNPEVIRIKTELAALRSQLSSLQSSSTRNPGDPVISASRLPESGFQYVRALRELKYHELLFEMLAKQFEAARIDETKTAPPIQVVDSAVPPEKKSGPYRTLIVLLAFSGSLTAGCMAAYFLHALRTARSIAKFRSLRTQLRAS